MPCALLPYALTRSASMGGASACLRARVGRFVSLCTHASVGVLAILHGRRYIMAAASLLRSSNYLGAVRKMLFAYAPSPLVGHRVSFRACRRSNCRRLL
eukprot:6202280-Pleurochrysis_carterae.AAC.4